MEPAHLPSERILFYPCTFLQKEHAIKHGLSADRPGALCKRIVLYTRETFSLARETLGNKLKVRPGDLCVLKVIVRKNTVRRLAKGRYSRVFDLPAELIAGWF